MEDFAGKSTHPPQGSAIVVAASKYYCIVFPNLYTVFFFFTAGSEGVKDIEFTVTTLNCPAESGTPEQRRRFSSLRKTGALSKAVRSKISKSFYNSSNSENKKNDRTVITVTPLDDEKINGNETTETDANKLAVGNKSTTSTTTITMTTNVAGSISAAPSKVEKHKKRSKLCQLL